ncbi:MAG: tRNA (N(6)-L-threonylcarbamoyladenosine(37)-C(2))-methylthiotransferase MtaB [bacterium TMED198]|nr:MAG: tRNA (N(6)-L-threonylcarbamoyladenosine(37)-C(2))-methylthiotransferase MtaB [bacterium TMED198]
MSSPYKTVALHTLGCKVNFTETSTISKQFENEGYSIVKSFDFADVYVVNTCSVTENADNKAHKLVKKLKVINNNSIIVLIGCYAQLNPQKAIKDKNIDLVIGAQEKFKIAEYINSIDKKNIVNSDISKVEDYVVSYSTNERVRSFIKVQDGCDYTCSYCTIPMARGLSRSGSIDEIILTANKIRLNNVKELVLSGINIGDFGKNNNETLDDLIARLDGEVEIPRYRISSIEPNLLSKKLINLISRTSSFMPHFHVPLQSGSDKVLRSMKRRYTVETYRKVIDRIRSLDSNACIGADVIVGYPEEDKNDFMDTYNFIDSLDLSYLHVFSYSDRKGTKSNSMINKNSKLEINERSKMLRGLSLIKQRNFLNSQVGFVRDVLFESYDNNGIYGFSDNYIRVKVPNISQKNKYINKIYKVKFINFEDHQMIGGLLN